MTWYIAYFNLLVRSLRLGVTSLYVKTVLRCCNFNTLRKSPNFEIHPLFFNFNYTSMVISFQWQKWASNYVWLLELKHFTTFEVVVIFQCTLLSNSFIFSKCFFTLKPLYFKAPLIELIDSLANSPSFSLMFFVIDQLMIIYCQFLQKCYWVLIKVLYPYLSFIFQNQTNIFLWKVPLFHVIFSCFEKKLEYYF